jgi:hypothetical protein
MLSSDTDDEKDMAYITNMVSGSVAGYKYFEIKQTGSIAVWVRGYVDGEVTVWQASPDDRFDEKTGHIGHRVGAVHVGSENIWTRYEMKVDMSGGVSALYFEYTGSNALQFLKFELIRTGAQSEKV